MHTAGYAAESIAALIEEGKRRRHLARPGPDEQTAAPVDSLTGEFWTWRLENEWYLRLQAGQEIERLPDLGPDEVQRQASIGASFLGLAARLQDDAAGTDADDTLGYLGAIAQRVITEAEHYWLMPIVTPYRVSDLLVMIDLAICQFRFERAGDVDRYLSLVRDLAGSIGSIAVKLNGQADREVYLAAPAYPGAESTLRGFVDGLRRRLVPATSRLAELGPAGRGRVQDGAESLVSGVIAAAIGSVGQALGRHRDRLSELVGLHQYAGGMQAYADLIRIETTMDLDADELHRIGKDECREIGERMQQVRGRLGFIGTEGDFNARLGHEPRLYAADADDVAARFERYIGRVEQKASDYFAVLPATPYGVARLDPTLEGGMRCGYYEPATRAQPVGLYRFNATSLPTRSLLTAAAVIYHELIPGHHYHVARQAENARLHPLRRHGFFNVSPAYTEGWAEYAAGLGWSMGLYDDPWDAYGRLAQERLTATRLVVDTAMNTGRWDLETARRFMRRNLIDTETQIVAESLRYATDIPAQALAYRTGYRAFTRLRERAEAALGTGFDERRFHEWVVECGTLPIPALESRVERHLAAAAGGSDQSQEWGD